MLFNAIAFKAARDRLLDWMRVELRSLHRSPGTVALRSAVLMSACITLLAVPLAGLSAERAVANSRVASARASASRSAASSASSASETATSIIPAVRPETLTVVVPSAQGDSRIETVQAQPSPAPRLFDWTSLGVGLLSFAVSAFAAVFAFRAASRSDRLLKRLVVYPYRELDLEFAQLLDGERAILMQVFEAGPADGLAAATVSAPGLRLPEVAVATGRLVDESWLVARNDRFFANPERVPYLKFIWESLHES